MWWHFCRNNRKRKIQYTFAYLWRADREFLLAWGVNQKKKNTSALWKRVTKRLCVQLSHSYQAQNELTGLKGSNRMGSNKSERKSEKKIQYINRNTTLTIPNRGIVWTLFNRMKMFGLLFVFFFMHRHTIVHRLRICNNFIFFRTLIRIICTNIALSARPSLYT